jgi:hypothetical protein
VRARPYLDSGSGRDRVIVDGDLDVPATKRGGADQLDRAGQSILHLLHKAAGVAEDKPSPRRRKPVATKLTPELGHRRRSSQKEIAGAAAPLGCHIFSNKFSGCEKGRRS